MTPDLPDDGRVSLYELDELDTLASEQEGEGEVGQGPLVHGQHHVARLGAVLGLHALLQGIAGAGAGAGADLHSSCEPVTGETEYEQEFSHPQHTLAFTGLTGCRVLAIHLSIALHRLYMRELHCTALCCTALHSTASATKTRGDSNFPNRPALGQLNLIE